MAVIAIVRVGFPKVDSQSSQFVRVLAGRFDNTVARLIGFSGGQPVLPRLNN